MWNGEEIERRRDDQEDDWIGQSTSLQFSHKKSFLMERKWKLVFIIILAKNVELNKNYC